MDPATLALLASLGGGIGSVISSSNTANATQQAQQNALAQYLGLSAPTDLANPLNLQQYQAGAKLNPQMESQLAGELANAKQYSEDPTMRNQQLAKLAGIESLSQTGFGAQDEAALMKALGRAGGVAQSSAEAAKQRFAATGQLGSGAQLAAELAGGQNAGQQASENAIQIAGNAATNRAQAMKDALAGYSNIRSQDTQQGEYNTSNAQAWQDFLAQNSSARQARNTQAANQGQLFNVTNENQAANANISQANAEMQRQLAAQQQMYNDQLALAQGKAGAYTGYANQLQQAGNAQAQGWQQMGTGVSGALAAYAKNSNPTAATTNNYNGFVTPVIPTPTQQTNSNPYWYPQQNTQGQGQAVDANGNPIS